MRKLHIILAAMVPIGALASGGSGETGSSGVDFDYELIIPLGRSTVHYPKNLYQ